MGSAPNAKTTGSGTAGSETESRLSRLQYCDFQVDLSNHQCVSPSNPTSTISISDLINYPGAAGSTAASNFASLLTSDGKANDPCYQHLPCVVVWEARSPPASSCDVRTAWHLSSTSHSLSAEQHGRDKPEPTWQHGT